MGKAGSDSAETVGDEINKTEAIKNMAGQIPGVSYVEVHVVNDIFRQAAESSR